MVGFGGLGDMACKLAKAMGAEVYVFTTTKEKLAEAERSIAETRAAAMGNVGQIARETAGAIVQHFTGEPAGADALATALVEAQGRAA